MAEFTITESMRRNGCIYRPGGVMCLRKTNCKMCGWNPTIERVRKAKIVLPKEVRI